MAKNTSRVHSPDRSAKNKVVLIQLSVAERDPQMAPYVHQATTGRRSFRPDPFKGSTKVHFLIVDNNSGDPVGRIYPRRVLASHLKNEGWAYLRLPAGNYSLVARPESPSQFGWRIRPEAIYRLDVPENHAVVYAGSFQLTYRPDMSGKDFRPEGMPSSFSYEVIYEPEDAVYVSSTEFRGSPSVTLSPMQPAGVFIPDRPIHDTDPFVVAVNSAPELQLPKWGTLERNQHFEYSIFITNMVAEAGAGGIIFAVPALGYMITSPVVGTGAGIYRRRVWKPVVSGLEDEIADLQPETFLSTLIAVRLFESGIAGSILFETLDNSSGFTEDFYSPLRIEAQMRRITIAAQMDGYVIRESVLVDGAVRFRVTDVRSGACFYDKTFTSSSSPGRLEFALDLEELPLRTREDLAGESGRALFRQDLTRILEAAVAEFIADACALDVFPLQYQ